MCVALGNTGSAEDVPALRRAAIDPDPLIAEHAAWALTQLCMKTQEPCEQDAGNEDGR